MYVQRSSRGYRDGAITRSETEPGVRRAMPHKARLEKQKKSADSRESDSKSAPRRPATEK